MNLSDYLSSKPHFYLSKIDVYDKSFFSKSGNIELKVQDNIVVSDFPESVCSVCFSYERKLISNPEDIISLGVSFKILLNLNDEGKKLSTEELLELAKKDSSISSVCSAKISALISGISSFMASEYPIVTPPTPIDLK